MIQNLKKMKMKIALVVVVLIVSLVKSYGQEFYSDGSMVVKKISTSTKYGYKATKKHSIKVGKIENQRAYLNSLTGPNGEAIEYIRLGRCCAFKSKKAAVGEGLLDKYEITYLGLKTPIIIYLN